MQSYGESTRQQRRLTILKPILVAAFALVVARLVQLQVVDHDRYQALAAKSHLRKFEIPAKRGQIYLTDGEATSPVALNQTQKILFADPSFIKDKPKTAQMLASITNKSAQDYLNLLNKPGEYVVIEPKLELLIADKIEALNMSGIATSERSFRVYPEGQLASQLIGFTNLSGEGQYGIERYLDQDLAGVKGALRAKTDTRGVPITTAENVLIPPKDGDSIVLSIERSVQAQVEKFLKEGVESVRATGGSVVVMDPKNGAILALANYPTYDPNEYSRVKESDYGLFANPAVSGLFEPGSGFKIFTMAAGLDTGKVKHNTTFDDKGQVEVGGRVIKNAANHKYGIQTMRDVIQKSLNTGVVYVLMALGGESDKVTTAGKKTLYQYLNERFGFGVRTGIEQPSEAAGVVNPPKSQDINYANMTFGQGVSVTVVQMTAAVAAIANGGKLYQPRLVKEIIKPDGTKQISKPRLVRDNVVSSDTASELTTMLELVVQHGSGYATKIPGYRVVGKTGTAQIPKPGGDGYEETKNIGSFIGYAPAEDPRFVMMVRINEPQVAGFAESTTVPVFKNIAEWLLRYWAVAPTRL